LKTLIASRPGGPEVLALAETALPEPGAEEVRIRVTVAGVNRADLLQRSGRYPPPPGWDPRRIGLEYAGTVDCTGARCILRRPGDRVMGLVAAGACSEFIVVPERETLSIPANLTDVAAAAIPEAFLTAVRALWDEGELTPGEAVLVRIATASVGLAAIQLAHIAGHPVAGTGRDSARLDALRALGLDHPLVEGGGMVQRARAAMGGAPRVVLDLWGGGRLSENLALLSDDGRLVVVGLLGGNRDTLDLATLLMRRQSIRTLTMRSQPTEARIALVRRFERQVLPLLAAGRLTMPIAQVYPVADAAQAHRDMERGDRPGKRVLLLATAAD
jgi:NADPH2:quinone reductase